MPTFCTSCGAAIEEPWAFCRSCGSKVTPSATAPEKPGSPSNQAERIFSQDLRGVTVTNTRLVVYNKTYALANVSSVSLEHRHPHKITGTLLIIVGFVVAAAQPLLGVGMIAIGGLLFLIKDHVVRLRTAGGESDALKTRNRAFAKQVTSSVEEAIVSRG